MRQLLVAFVLIAAVSGAPASGQAPRWAIDNVSAFARLYGVVRYFYPSDAAASLEWNRFAVHGVKQVRAARDAKELQATLQTLFTPLGPGLEIGQKLSSVPAPGSPDSQLVAWRYLGAGMAGASVSGPYKGKRTNRPMTSSSSEAFTTLMQSVPALYLRGKAIRLRGLVRATPGNAAGAAALWMRVDRADRQVGFFDNMSNRPIREPEWREYVIEGPVADDATNLAFGVMASGAVTADYEAIALEQRDAAGGWAPITIKDPGFEWAPDARSEGWVRAGQSNSAAITRPTDKAPEGQRFLRIAPASSPATPSPSTAELFESPPVLGAHADIDLGPGLRARVPLALSEAQAIEDATRSSSLTALRAAIASVKDAGDQADLDTRLADVVVAWNVFRHFYPYWTESRVDWDARLPTEIERMFGATTRATHLDALRLLVADVHDGHGAAIDVRNRGERGWLPVQLGIIEGQLVVTATGAPANAPVGAIVATLDGVPAGQRMSVAMGLASGTAQWKETRALWEISTCPMGTVVTLVVDSGAGPRSSNLRCDAKQPPPEKRPDPVVQLTSGVWYVDLTRAKMVDVTPVISKLAQATGVVFDVRGYPTDAGAQMLPYLLETSEADRWMHVNKIVGPFGHSAGWQSIGWNLKPRSPRLAGKVVFLTDGRAISYAESVMGYVADRKLATIVGGTTAGANGNVVTFTVPGGFRLAFTGMRVTKHDGQTPHHLAGVKPDVPAAPTIAGVRAGRDEVLDAAVALLRGQ
jgi:hypothetical protein